VRSDGSCSTLVNHFEKWCAVSLIGILSIKSRIWCRHCRLQHQIRNEKSSSYLTNWFCLVPPDNVIHEGIIAACLNRLDDPLVPWQLAQHFRLSWYPSLCQFLVRIIFWSAFGMSLEYHDALSVLALAIGILKLTMPVEIGKYPPQCRALKISRTAIPWCVVNC